MAMTFTAISKDPILVEEGTFTMNYKASGTIYAGSAVCCSGGTELVRVNVANAGNTMGSGYVGVAQYSVTDGKQISVIGPGNKVRVRASGAITAGQDIVAVSKGFFQPQTFAGSGSNGVALENISDNGYGKVLLW